MAYTTVSDVKTYMGIASANDDVLLGDLLTSAQALIDAHTRRTFEASADSTRKFDAVRDVDGMTLILDADLAAITTITNGDATIIASTEYVTEPRNKTPYREIKLLSSKGISWTYTDDPENAISITGKWAYSTTAPSDIEHACIRLVAWLYRQKDNSNDSDRPLLTSDGVTILPSRIPSDVKTILRPYVKLV